MKQNLAKTEGFLLQKNEVPQPWLLLRNEPGEGVFEYTCEVGLSRSKVNFIDPSGLINATVEGGVQITFGVDPQGLDLSAGAFFNPSDELGGLPNLGLTFTHGPTIGTPSGGAFVSIGCVRGPGKNVGGQFANPGVSTLGMTYTLNLDPTTGKIMGLTLSTGVGIPEASANFSLTNTHMVTTNDAFEAALRRL